MSSSYESIAAWYDNQVRTDPLYRQMVLPSMLKLAGPVDGLTVCDVACGQGLVSRELAERGARVIGVDISPALLSLGRQQEAQRPLGIEYRLDDAQTLATLPAVSVDAVTCGMALMNIPDIAASAGAIKRVLKAGGWFVATITHPCFQTPVSRWVQHADGRMLREVAGYFDEGFWQSANPGSVRARIGEHHRTFASYVNTFAAAGLYLEQVDEPRASGERAVQSPGNLEVPSIVTLRFSTAPRL